MGVIKSSKEAVTPENPPEGFCKLYFKADGALYALDENGIETPISDTDVLAKVSSNDSVAKYLEDAIIADVGTNSVDALELITLNDGSDEDLRIRFDEAKLSLTASQISDFNSSVQAAETDTTFQKIGNTLRYIGEDGTNQDVDLSTYLDDTNLARLVSGTINPSTGIATFTRDDATDFTIDLSSLIDIETVTTLTESPSGVFKYTSEDATETTIDISGLSSASHVQNTDTSLDFGNPNQVTASEIRSHLDDATIHFTQAAISITSSQVSDFNTSVQAAETDTTLQLIGNNLRYIGEDGTNQDVDLSPYIDDTNLARIVSGSLNPTTGIMTLTRDDASDFTVDLSALLDTDTTDHTLLSNIGVNTHAQIDSHISDSTIHFTQAAISITASQVSDFDTEVSNNASVTANTAKVTNATHTGEVTGSGALTVDKTAISNQTEVTAATDDYVLIGDTSDTDNLKKVTAQSIADLFNGNNGLVSKADSVAGASFVTASGDKVYDVVFSTAFADANYSISISASIERMWTWESKTATGFRINAHSNSDLTGETVDWVATKHGES